MQSRYIFILFALFPHLAFAQNLFEPTPGDKSMLVLGSIFGGLGVFGSNGTDPFIAGIMVFNSAVLILGGLLVAYTILIGTIGTAHEGEMLGKKFSSVWIPIRTAVGTSLVLPVIGGGYCVMQLLVGWLIVQGIGLADLVWKEYTKAENLSSLAAAGLQSTSVKDFGYKIFASQACVSAINAIAKTTPGQILFNQGIQADAVFSNSTGDLGSTKNIVKFGVSPEGNGLNEVSCGTAEIPLTPSRLDFTRTSSGGITTILDWSGVSQTGEIASAQNRSKEIVRVQNEQAKELIKTMGILANNTINTLTPPDPGAIDAAIAVYEGKVRAEASKQISSLKEFSTLGQNASKDGWFLAGAFYVKMAYMADLVNRSVSDFATATGPKAFSNKTIKDEMLKYETILTRGLSSSSSSVIDNGFGVKAESGIDADIDTSLSWSNIKNFDFNAVAKKMFKLQQFVVDDKEHPLMAIKRLGNTMITTVTVSTGLAIIFPTVLEKFSKSAASFVQTAFFIFVIPILVTAVTLSYILPMMPFFLWFGAVLGWLIMCVQAILAAPMWAVMHLSPHGDDLVGTGSQGYKLLLSLILRPVLMIFGLISSFILLSVVGTVLTKIFFDVFVINQADTSFIPWIIGYILSPILYCIAMFVLIKKLFSLIHIVPDELLKWFGGGGEQLGSYANTIGGESSGSYTALGTIVNTGSAGTRDGIQAMKTDKTNSLLKGAENREKEEKILGEFSEKQIKQEEKYGAGAASFIAEHSGAVPGAGKEAILKSAEIEKELGNTSISMGSDANKTMFMAKLGELNEQNKTLPSDKQKTYSQLIGEAAAHTLDASYGKGTSQVANHIGNPGSTDYMRFVNSVDGNYKKLSKETSPEMANQLLGTAMESTLKEHAETGGSGNIKTTFKQQMQAVYAGLSTPTTPPPPPPPPPSAP